MNSKQGEGKFLFSCLQENYHHVDFIQDGKYFLLGLVPGKAPMYVVLDASFRIDRKREKVIIK